MAVKNLQKSLQIAFQKGMLNTMDPTLITEDAVVTGCNLEIVPVGFRKRLGTDAITTGFGTSSTGVCYGLFEASVPMTGSNRYQISCWNNGYVYAQTNQNTTKTTLATGLSTGSTQLWSADVLDDLVIITNGVDEPKKWDGTTFANAATTDVTTGSDQTQRPQKSKFVFQFDSKMWHGYTTESSGADLHKLRVRWSKDGDSTKYPLNNWKDLISSAADDEVVGGMVLNNASYLFTTKTIFRCWNNGNATESLQYSFEDLRPGVGAASHQSLVNTPAGIAFAGYGLNAFYLFDGSTITDISSELILKTIQGLNHTKGKYVSGCYMPAQNQIRWTVTTGTVNDTILVYDLTRKIWLTPWTNINAGYLLASIQQGSSTATCWYGTSNAVGKLCQMDKGTNDLGAAIPFWVYSPQWDFDLPNITKRIEFVDVHCQTITSPDYLTINWNLDLASIDQNSFNLDVSYNGVLLSDTDTGTSFFLGDPVRSILQDPSTTSSHNSKEQTDGFLNIEGDHIQMKITQSVINQPFQCQTIHIGWKPLRQV